MQGDKNNELAKVRKYISYTKTAPGVGRHPDRLVSGHCMKWVLERYGLVYALVECLRYDGKPKCMDAQAHKYWYQSMERIYFGVFGPVRNFSH